MASLNDLITRAEKIVDDQNRTQYEKDVALAGLMTQMESEYGVPYLNNEKWNAAHPEIIDTYRKIGNMRSL